MEKTGCLAGVESTRQRRPVLCTGGEISKSMQELTSRRKCNLEMKAFDDDGR